ncbi:MAG TPA: 3-oxoacyl-[acyl-carrier-protein] synthase III C-terminal domain-containing protein [Rhodoglobus sp.]|nr:3-oxoacyl-[acyl-carrier-protein] synthase III C-terminal domain-containing protein [Rhodoglobus sp.]
MSRIAATVPVLPAYSYPQEEITRVLAPLISPAPERRAVLQRMHASSGIGTRHTALPIEQYEDLGSFREVNDIYIRLATDLAERAVREALDRVGLEAPDVDYILFTSVTGIAAPSIDALLVSRMGLRPDVKRMPSFGLGCVGGAAGIARVDDYLAGHPGEVGVLISVELCSLTLQRDDATVANFVATGLFGDGGAAVVLVGDDRPEPGIRVLGTRSCLFPDSEDVIGWHIGGTGFEIVLTAGVADVIAKHFPDEVAAFLGDHGLTVDDIGAWVAHPGGPRVLDAFAASVDAPADAFARSWGLLDRTGNLSSAAVLHVLADFGEQPAGTRGLLFALGPGVSAEFVLLEWT